MKIKFSKLNDTHAPKWKQTQCAPITYFKLLKQMIQCYLLSNTNNYVKIKYCTIAYALKLTNCKTAMYNNEFKNQIMYLK